MHPTSDESQQHVSRSLPWPRSRILLAVVTVAAIAFAGFALFDYWRFQQRDRAALHVVSQLGGKTGSLMGWPMGKEYRIVFTRPLNDEELRQLAAIEPPRGSLGIMFTCDMTEAQLQTAPGCPIELSSRIPQPAARSGSTIVARSIKKAALPAVWKGGTPFDMTVCGSSNATEFKSPSPRPLTPNPSPTGVPRGEGSRCTHRLVTLAPCAGGARASGPGRRPRWRAAPAWRARAPAGSTARRPGPWRSSQFPADRRWAPRQG